MYVHEQGMEVRQSNSRILLGILFNQKSPLSEMPWMGLSEGRNGIESASFNFELHRNDSARIEFTPFEIL